jgi:hypothetical protein
MSGEWPGWRPTRLSYGIRQAPPLPTRSRPHFLSRFLWSLVKNSMADLPEHCTHPIDPLWLILGPSTTTLADKIAIVGILAAASCWRSSVFVRRWCFTHQTSPGVRITVNWILEAEEYCWGSRICGLKFVLSRLYVCSFPTHSILSVDDWGSNVPGSA